MPPPGYTASRSLLDKPLYQLTEDDISQVTREDCRKYLKEKGMRRPSWNKSQAIQQVISLKTLLETPLDSDHPGALKPLYVSAPENSCAPIKETSAENPSNSVPTVVSVSKVHALDGPPADIAASANDLESTRATGAVYESAGQMTIFYCGKVNVYEGVSRDKARAIMQLAANPLLVPSQLDTGVKTAPNPMLTFPIMQKGGPASRHASVQRYLEKRKDRFKNKKKVAIPSAAGLDIFFNHMMRDEISNDHWNQNEEWSFPKPKLPQTPQRCSSVDNAAKKIQSLY